MSNKNTKEQTNVVVESRSVEELLFATQLHYADERLLKISPSYVTTPEPRVTTLRLADGVEARRLNDEKHKLGITCKTATRHLRQREQEGKGLN
ncbi:hypothetical protein J6590_095703, partial [Homalodisca vitripennis]